MELGAVYLVAPDDIEVYALPNQSYRQAEGVRPVLTAGQQTNLDSRLRVGWYLCFSVDLSGARFLSDDARLHGEPERIAKPYFHEPRPAASILGGGRFGLGPCRTTQRRTFVVSCAFASQVSRSRA